MLSLTWRYCRFGRWIGVERAAAPSDLADSMKTKYNASDPSRGSLDRFRSSSMGSKLGLVFRMVRLRIWLPQDVCRSILMLSKEKLRRRGAWLENSVIEGKNPVSVLEIESIMNDTNKGARWLNIGIIWANGLFRIPWSETSKDTILSQYRSRTLIRKGNIKPQFWGMTLALRYNGAFPVLIKRVSHRCGSTRASKLFRLTTLPQSNGELMMISLQSEHTRELRRRVRNAMDGSLNWWVSCRRRPRPSRSSIEICS